MPLTGEMAVDIKTYLFLNNKKFTYLADLTGYHRHYIWAVANGYATPGIEFIKTIYKVTDGAVTLSDYPTLNKKVTKKWESLPPDWHKQ
jgi:hypothetical protein